LDSLPDGVPNSIEISDVDGFTDLINSIPADKTSIDVLLLSPGGRPDAAERIVSMLRRRFKEVHFLIPHSAYSAATMIALSGDTITLHPSATLGPIDPQIGGVPARSIKRGFQNVKDHIKKEGPNALPPYIPLIEKYTLPLLEICDDSEKLSKELVKTWLRDYMFAGQKNMGKKIAQIVKYFSDYDTHLTHARPISIEKLQKYKLSLSYSDGELSELLWEAHILIIGFFNILGFVKLFENAHGVSWGKQIQVVQQGPMPIPTPVPPQAQPTPKP
jgi:ClpP class serine protease